MKDETNPLNTEIDPLDYSRWLEREHERRFGPPRRAWVCAPCSRFSFDSATYCMQCWSRGWSAAVMAA